MNEDNNLDKYYTETERVGYEPYTPEEIEKIQEVYRAMDEFETEEEAVEFAYRELGQELYDKHINNLLLEEKEKPIKLRNMMLYGHRPNDRKEISIR